MSTLATFLGIFGLIVFGPFLWSSSFHRWYAEQKQKTPDPETAAAIKRGSREGGGIILALAGIMLAIMITYDYFTGH
jgi:ABC-type phosphate transport system permease subunit